MEQDTIKCFGCDAQIAATPGNYYCDECVKRQTTEHAAEREAFDAYHAYADRVAREGTR